MDLIAQRLDIIDSLPFSIFFFELLVYFCLLYLEATCIVSMLGMFSMLALVLVAVIRPYSNKWQDVFDILLLLCASSFYQFKNLDLERFFMSQSPFYSISFANMSLLFPVIYMLCRIVYFFIPRCCIVKVKEMVNGCLRKDLKESLPHRLQQSNECSPLIK